MLIKLLLTRRFIFLFLLLVCYTLCCRAQSTSGLSNTAKSAPLFDSEKVNALKSKDGDTQKENIPICKIKTFSLVAAEGLMLALVKTWQTKEKGDNANILVKYVETGEKWGDKVIQNINSDDKWKVQLVTEDKPSANKHFAKITSVANVKKNKIYIFALNSTTEENDQNDGVVYNDVNITLYEGIITNKVNEPKGKTISWNNKISSKLSEIVKNQEGFKEDILKLFITDIFAFLTKDDKIVLLLKIKIDDENTKTMTFLIDVETPTNSVEFSYIDTVDSCDPHLFPWNNKIIMMSTNCKKKSDSVTFKEFTEKTKWVDSSGSFFYLLEFFKNKKDFTSAKSENNNLLFVTQLRNNDVTGDSADQHSSYLFISDGTRVYEVGLIAADVSNTEPVKLLFISDELFTLHKKSTKEEDYKNVMLTRQQDLLATIQLVGNSWSNADNNIKKQCAEFFGKNTICDTNLFTDGLVGFLSNDENKNNDTLWHDEYFYVNATVDKGVKTNNGFQFNKPGARAVWPVDKQEEGTSYNFADFGFTLVATVKFDKPQKMDQKSSVLGVTLDKSTESVGVWCLNNKVFALSEDGQELAEEIPKSECVAGKKYHIALVYNNSKVSVFVDWERLGGEKDFKMDKDAQKNLQFYFGAAAKEDDVESHVTVKNVLLYNRPFTDKEFEMLKISNENTVLPLPNDDISDTVQNTDGDGSNPLNFKISQGDDVSPLDTLTTETSTQPNEGVVQSSSHQKENAVCVKLGVLYVLLVDVWILSFFYLTLSK